MKNQLLIPVSVGELFDKVSILEIKSSILTAKSKLDLVINELEMLKSVIEHNDLQNIFDSDLYHNLKKTNKELWDICDIRRVQEREKSFDDNFINYSRKEYITNDKRAEIKKSINNITDSIIKEVKCYES